MTVLLHCLYCTEYKYREVVRKKAEREALRGFECADCARFYAACESWLTPGDAPPPPGCGHVAQAQRPSGGSSSPYLLFGAAFLGTGFLPSMQMSKPIAINH